MVAFVHVFHSLQTKQSGERQHLLGTPAGWNTCNPFRKCTATLMKLESEQDTTTRLFSNVALDETGSLSRRNVSEVSCAALISGTMIGAGVLALPEVTAAAGFLPSSFALIAVWIYMLCSALLITEVSLSSVCSLGRPSGVSLLSLGTITLGKTGGAITAVVYTLLHYAILTAYTAQGGTILQDLVHILTQTQQFLHSETIAQVGFALGLGTILYSLSDERVDQLNNSLVLAVVASFFVVLLSLAPAFDAHTLFSVFEVGQVPRAVPVLFVSCVFHNIVGTISSRLEGDIPKIRRAIVGGSAVPLAMFLLFNAAVLGGLHVDGVPSTAIIAVDSFSILAIVTSFIGFTAGLVDLWSDVRISVLKQQPDRVETSLVFNYLATVVPPAVFCILNRDIFLKALDVAGTYGIAVLFGILPAAMAWKSRDSIRGFPTALPGGKLVLAAMMVPPSVLILSKLTNLFYNFP